MALPSTALWTGPLRINDILNKGAILSATKADKIGFVWLCFKKLMVRCFLLLVIVIIRVTVILDVLEIGFV
jgi:hypothetical protein